MINQLNDITKMPSVTVIMCMPMVVRVSVIVIVRMVVFLIRVEINHFDVLAN